MTNPSPPGGDRVVIVFAVCMTVVILAVIAASVFLFN
jgi:hypothetical protein